MLSARPEKPYTSIKGESLALGVLLGRRKFSVEWTTKNDVNCVINYPFRTVIIYFKHLGHEYKVEFKFRDLHNGEIKFNERNATREFLMSLKHPPSYWRVSVQSLDVRLKQWTRVTRIPVDAVNLLSDLSLDSACPYPGATGIDDVGENGYLALGSWTVLCVSFSRFAGRSVPRKKVEEALLRGREYRLFRKPPHHYFSFRTVSKAYTHTHRKRTRLIDDFKLLYSLESAIQSQRLIEQTLDTDFYKTLQKLKPNVATELLRFMWGGIHADRSPEDIMEEDEHGAIDKDEEHKRVWFPGQMLATLAKKQENLMSFKLRSKPKNTMQVCKVVVTPTTVQLELPYLEQANRVLRHFAKYADRFLRVQFADEGQRRIQVSSKPNHTITAVYDRILKTLTSGIRIGTRHYEFLAFSSSQLREHGCWFFSSVPGELTADDIRRWMGDFSKERVVAKYCARMGQCFSTTSPTTKLKESELEFIEDITFGDYTFSDGVGLISKELADVVARKLHLKHTPSAFQVRLGGAKGMLTVHPAIKDRKVQLRPSQIKFETSHRMLEINRCATLSNVHLNRQIVMVLTSLGVPNHCILALRDEMVHDIEKMLTDSHLASRVIRRNTSHEMMGVLARLVDVGFMDREDPFVMNLISMVRVSWLKDIKKRASINVPNGVTLYGVMDETHTLEPNQIFCQYTAHPGVERGKFHRVIKGECMVYRHPCMHPGDIRVVEAVKCASLSHLVNVIVFPAKGERDIPSMCGGGDLDGDLFSVVWDNRLLPVMKNCTPMDYRAPPPLKVEHQVQLSDIRNFFVHYIQSDNLGAIANNHLARADQSSQGVSNPICMELAKLHSAAVDFPKTGISAEFPYAWRLKSFPDYMEKFDKASYRSQHVLGEIYRSIDAKHFENYHEHLVYETIYDTRLRMEGMERYIYEARNLKERYDQELGDIMRRFGIKTEAEVISGYVIKWLKKDRMNMRPYEMLQLVRQAVSRLWEAWQHAHFSHEIPKLEKQRKAAAWYYVTYHRAGSAEFAGDNRKHKKFSFPWIASKVLIEIARKNKHCSERPDDANAVPETLILSYSGADASRSQDSRSSPGLTDASATSASIPVSDEEDEDKEDEYGHDVHKFEGDFDGIA